MAYQFIADVMVGRLATWLRILGYDVLYDNRIEDRQLVETAAREGRIILTRDTRLIERKAARPFIFIQSDYAEAQLVQVLRELGVRAIPGLFTRCLICNRPLEPVTREQAKGRVPAYVYETQLRFNGCRHCQKIYWAGTHRQHMLDILQKLLPLEVQGSEPEL